jgi:hypothetical protein
MALSMARSPSATDPLVAQAANKTGMISVNSFCKLPAW